MRWEHYHPSWLAGWSGLYAFSVKSFWQAINYTSRSLSHLLLLGWLPWQWFKIICHTFRSLSRIGIFLFIILLTGVLFRVALAFLLLILLVTTSKEADESRYCLRVCRDPSVMKASKHHPPHKGRNITISVFIFPLW